MAILIGDVKAAVECTVRMCKEFMERRADRWREELNIGCSELQGIICVCIWGDATNQIEWVEEQRKALREFAYEKYSENKPVGADAEPVKGGTAEDGGEVDRHFLDYCISCGCRFDMAKADICACCIREGQ